MTLAEFLFAVLVLLGVSAFVLDSIRRHEDVPGYEYDGRHRAERGSRDNQEDQPRVGAQLHD